MNSSCSVMVLCLLVLTFTACERPDLDDPKGESPQALVELPVGHGLGTQQSPFTAGDVLAGRLTEGGTGECWLMGYAVGSTYRSMGQAQFSVPTTFSTNVLLSDDSLCTDEALCVPVELKGTALQKRLSLSAQPGMWRRLLVVRGTSGRYFARPGLREASAGYWLPTFDLATISPVPTPWEERDSIFY